MSDASASHRSPIIRVFDCFVVRAEAEGLGSRTTSKVAPRTEPLHLLLRRATDKVYGGDWRMIGGKIRPDETAWQACLREIQEETQLPIDELWTVPYVNRFYEWQRDRINDIPVFLGITRSASPILDEEHDAFEWLPAEEAAQRLVWPAQREGLRAADRFFRDPGALVEHCRIDIGHPR